MSFFSKISYEQYLEWLDESEQVFRINEKISELGGEIMNLEEANRIEFYLLFENLVRRGKDGQESYESLPLPSWTNIPLPGEFDDHKDLSLGSQDLESIVTDYVNSEFSSIKYIFSGNGSNYEALKFERFSYHFLKAIWNNHSQDSLVLTDEKLDKVIIFTQTMNLAIFSQKLVSENFNIAGCGLEDFEELFVNQYQNCVPGLTKEAYLHLKVTYAPRLATAIPEYKA